jgi:NNP family nitrate/nitrite transporter-like MFS transporter
VAIQNITTPFWVFIIIALLCGFAGRILLPAWEISVSFPKRNRAARWDQRRPWQSGVSVMQMVAPAVIFLPLFTFLGVHGVTQPDGSTITLSNAALVWVPLLLLATVAAWFGMNDIAGSKASIRDQLPVLKRPHMWLKPALSGDVWLVHRLFRRLCHAGENPVSRVDILKLAFFGPFIGALARSFGGIISDRLGGVRVTLVNFVLMALFTGLLFLTLPGSGSGSFRFLRGVYGALSAGLGSGSTFQMIAVIFRQITIDSVKKRGGSDEQAQHEADRYRGGARLYLRHRRDRRLLYPESLRHLAGDDRLPRSGR